MAATTSSSVTRLQSADEEVERAYAVVIKHQSHMDPIKLDHTVLTTVTKHPDVVRRWIDGVGNTNVSRHVGFEIEYSFNTVELCVGNRCLVYPLPRDRGSFPPSLVEFLCDHNRFIFVGTNIQINMNWLKMAYEIRGVTGRMKELGRKPTIKKKNLLWALLDSHPDSNGHLVLYSSLHAFLNLQVANCCRNLH